MEAQKVEGLRLKVSRVDGIPPLIYIEVDPSGDTSDAGTILM